MPGGFRTVGHSNRSLATFVGILGRAGVEVVADVRSFPRSRTNPAFGIDSLPDDLLRHGIGYVHFPDLGGRRGAQRDVPGQLNALWRNPSFHNYADYAQSERFGAAYSELVDLGQSRLVAVMCSEAVWWRCHRRILADYLLMDGFRVIHLMGAGRETPATPTPGAQRRSDGKVIYPEADDGLDGHQP